MAARFITQVSTRLDADLLAELERAAEEEVRQTRSGVVRDVLSNWAASRRAGDETTGEVQS